MKAGIRVIRGPDWKWGNQDGGVGQIGTVIKPGFPVSHNTVVNGSVFIRWDSGKLGNYHVAQQHDLKVYNSACAGIEHHASCKTCQDERNILGTHWKCSSCENFDLCDNCYHGDQHKLDHQFLRRDLPSSDGVLVPARKDSLKLEVKGVFPCATVIRNVEDWILGQSDDGGQGTTGTVVINDDDAGLAKSLQMGAATSCRQRLKAHGSVRVRWTTGNIVEHRRAFNGKVDVFSRNASDTVSGGTCYADHLAILDSTMMQDNAEDGKSEEDNESSDGYDSSDDSRITSQFSHIDSLGELLTGNRRIRLLDNTDRFSRGDRVRVTLDPHQFKKLQYEQYGGWDDAMALYIGVTGTVLGVLPSGGVAVHYAKMPRKGWNINPDALSKGEFFIGDSVQILADEAAVRRLQIGHGGWVYRMKDILGKVSEIVQLYHGGTMIVKLDKMNWLLNTECCKLMDDSSSATGKIDLDSDNDDEGTTLSRMLLRSDGELSGILSADGSLSGIVCTRRDVSGILSADGGLSGICNHGDMSGILSADGGLSGILCSRRDRSGIISADGGMSGIICVRSDRSGIISADGGMSGICNHGDMSGILSADGGMSGIICARRDRSGIISGSADGGMSGIICARRDKSGIISADGGMSGILSNHGDMSSILSADGGMSGIICARRDRSGIISGSADGGMSGILCNHGDMSSMLSAGAMHGLKPELLAQLAATNEIDCVKAIIAQHPDKLELKNCGKTALHLSIVFGHIEVVKYLVEHGANILEPDDDNGDTAVHYAIHADKADILEVLLAKDDDNANAVNYHLISVLSLAVHKQAISCIRVLLRHNVNVNAQDEEGDTALHLAIYVSCLGAIDLIAAHPTLDFLIMNNNGLTVLQLAVGKNELLAIKSIVRHAPQQSVDFQTKGGTTALHIACLNGLYDAAEVLVTQGKANMELVNDNHHTPLLTSLMRSNVSIVELLASHGANVNACNNNYDTGLHMILMMIAGNDARNHTVDMFNAVQTSLIYSKLPQSLRDRQWVAVACCLVRYGANIYQSNCAGMTPIGLVADSEIRDALMAASRNRISCIPKT